MAQIIQSNKALTVNPLKVSQPMGASLAFMGLAKSVPLEHGAQGCTAFSKVFFTRHFREPVPLQTTAMDQVVTILGADENIIEALDTIARICAPAVVGLVTTGLAETQGSDVPGSLKDFCARHPEHAGMAVVTVSTPDTLGCLESGFALAVEAMVGQLVPASAVAGRRPLQVNLLASPMLTPGDIEVLKEWMEAFGLTAIVLPDLGDSLDGHLSDAGYSNLSSGGTTLADIAAMGESAATLVVGPSLGKAADILAARTGVPDYRFDSLMGLDACDALTGVLKAISGREVPERLMRQRAQLLDAMVDAHFPLGGARFAVAADADLLGMLGRFLVGLGGEVVVAVASSRAESLAGLPVDNVIVGDLEDLETRARQRGAHLVVANSHAVEVARRLGVPLLRAGFPQYDLLGGASRQWIGYRGSRQALFDLANLLASRRQEIAPYRSVFWQGTPRELEHI
ncbi:MAG: nitrogenase iron-molybdenum cofactor biosynthesis protein NifN [Zoogloea sp.]|nr:nitrogenase iron-molybdenum cofactor biosynthesis protein NifN [Zoogloea sp.]